MKHGKLGTVAQFQFIENNAQIIPHRSHTQIKFVSAQYRGKHKVYPYVLSVLVHNTFAPEIRRQKIPSVYNYDNGGGKNTVAQNIPLTDYKYNAACHFNSDNRVYDCKQ